MTDNLHRHLFKELNPAEFYLTKSDCVHVSGASSCCFTQRRINKLISSTRPGRSVCFTCSLKVLGVGLTISCYKGCSLSLTMMMVVVVCNCDVSVFQKTLQCSSFLSWWKIPGHWRGKSWESHTWVCYYICLNTWVRKTTLTDLNQVYVH